MLKAGGAPKPPSDYISTEIPPSRFEISGLPCTTVYCAVRVRTTPHHYILHCTSCILHCEACGQRTGNPPRLLAPKLPKAASKPLDLLHTANCLTVPYYTTIHYCALRSPACYTVRDTASEPAAGRRPCNRPSRPAGPPSHDPAPGQPGHPAMTPHRCTRGEVRNDGGG